MLIFPPKNREPRTARTEPSRSETQSEVGDVVPECVSSSRGERRDKRHEETSDRDRNDCGCGEGFHRGAILISPPLLKAHRHRARRDPRRERYVTSPLRRSVEPIRGPGVGRLKRRARRRPRTRSGARVQRRASALELRPDVFAEPRSVAETQLHVLPARRGPYSPPRTRTRPQHREPTERPSGMIRRSSKVFVARGCRQHPGARYSDHSGSAGRNRDRLGGMNSSRPMAEIGFSFCPALTPPKPHQADSGRTPKCGQIGAIPPRSGSSRDVALQLAGVPPRDTRVAYRSGRGSDRSLRQSHSSVLIHEFTHN